MATAQTLLQQYLTGFCVLRLDLNEVQESDGNSKSNQGWQAAPGETSAVFFALSDTEYHMDGKGKFDQGWQAAPVIGGAYTNLLDKKTALTAAMALASYTMCHKQAALPAVLPVSQQAIHLLGLMHCETSKGFCLH